MTNIFLKSLHCSNGVQVQTQTSPGPEVWVQGPHKVAGPDLDRTGQSRYSRSRYISSGNLLDVLQHVQKFNCVIWQDIIHGQSTKFKVDVHVCSMPT